MKFILSTILLFCTVTLNAATYSEDVAAQDGDVSAIEETNKIALFKRSVDSDGTSDGGARCISCGKLGGSYSASASASAAASASSGSSSNEESESYSIPVPSYSSNYNTYPRQRMSSQYQKSYGMQNENVPMSSYPQTGSSSSYSSSSRYHSLPQFQTSMPASSSGQSSQSSYQYSQSGGLHTQPNSYNTDNFQVSDNFDEEMDRMRSAMNEGNFNYGQYPHYTNGGSHRSEYSSESQYVNGKPVYEKKAEKRYKNGQVVHDSLIEKGPEELGTSDALLENSQPTPYQSSYSYSNQYDGNSGSSFVPAISANYPSYPNKFRPMSKETYYSETQSTSHQPVYPGYERVSGDSNLQRQNTRKNNIHSLGVMNPSPASTKTVESSYKEEKIISNNPQQYIPVTNPVSHELNYNITRSSSHSRSSDSNNAAYQSPTLLNTQDASNLRYTDNYPAQSKTSELPYDVPNSNAYQGSMTSYNKETRYSSGMDSSNKNVARDEIPVYRQPYENRASASLEATRHYNSMSQQSSDKNDKRYDVSPYNDNQETEDHQREDKYVFGRTPNVQSGDVNKDMRYYKEYYSRNAKDIQTDNVNKYNGAGYTKHSDNTHNTPYRVPAYTRLPSRFLETKTSYKYRNGKLIGEITYNRLYEDNLLISQNTTERTRQQMINDGVDVWNLDLKLVRVKQPVDFNTKEELIYDKESFETSHKPLIGVQNPDPYWTPRDLSGNSYMESKASFKSENVRNHNNNINTGSNGLRRHESSQPLYAHLQPIERPQSSVKKHEIYEEEEFINGEKVYDLHHERKFKDHKLVHENKTELLPHDLGVGNKANDNFTPQTQEQYWQQLPLSTKHGFSQGPFKTTCLSCVDQGMNNLMMFNRTNGHKTVSLQAPHGNQLSTINQGRHGGFSEKTIRKDLEIEEHYENGKLVKGKEESKKWTDGRLIDSKSETYHQGPSRTSKLDIGKDFSSLPRIPSYSRDLSRHEECIVNQCQNGATCRKTASTSNVCLCTFGFKGNFCETAYCPNRFCRYGGSCSITNNNHGCACQEGFTGYRCKTRVHKVRMSPSGY